MREEKPNKPKGGGARIAIIVVIILLIAGSLAFIRRVTESHALAAETRDLSVQTVTVVHPKVESSTDEMVLPGQTQAYIESGIWARTNGYLAHWYKDIGARVNKGDLLAVIETPEVDQELAQAIAAREQVKAQLQLAKISAERWQNLLKSDSVSKQEADQQTSGYAQAQANYAAADANVKRLQQLENFKRIYAPFSGVVIRRNVDIGALINAGQTATPLFTLAQVDPLRVYVSVPELEAPSVRSGMKAYLTLQEKPGEKFEGKIVRTADAIDPTTRTLLTEVDVPNKSDKLLAGSYTEVHFAVPVQVQRITVPSNALLFRAEGTRIATVGADGKVQLKPVQIGRDFGTSVEIVNGLQPQDQIVLNPPDSLEDGQQVNVVGGEAPQARSQTQQKKGE